MTLSGTTGTASAGCYHGQQARGKYRCKVRQPGAPWHEELRQTGQLPAAGAGAEPEGEDGESGEDRGSGAGAGAEALLPPGIW